MVYHCFVDYTKAFETVWHDGLWAVLESYQVPQKLVKLLKNLYNQSELAVKVNGHLGEWFHSEVGSRQGDPLSPLLFITLLERVITIILERLKAISRWSVAQKTSESTYTAHW